MTATKRGAVRRSRRDAVPTKRGLALLVGMSLVTLSACANDGGTGSPTDDGSTSAGSEPAAPSDANLRIAFIPGIASDPFFRAMELAAKDEASALGVELIWQGATNEYSPQAQLPFVDSALAEDIDALVLVPTDADALQPSVDRAIAEGIPVVTVDTTVSDTSGLLSHITGDNLDGGQRAAEEMARQVGGPGKILLISASPTNTTGTQRVKGFQDAAAESYPELELLEVQYAYSQPATATSILNTTLLAHPDLAGVFAVDGTSCTGAVAGLQNSDKVGDVTLICYDAYANQVDELEKGVVSALIAQDPAQEARLALQYAVAKVTGEGVESIESTVVIPNVIMNVDNLDETGKYEYAE